jgi:acyl-CoA synthetase (AMP-forming)/AMP-acid ligase II
MPKRLLLKELSRYNIGTFADIIYRNSLLYPDQEAFIYEGKRVTFSQFNGRINKLIYALKKKGVKKVQPLASYHGIVFNLQRSTVLR